MRKDYQFLIGHRFSVRGEIYVVQDLTKQDEQTYVKAATCGDEIIIREVSEDQPEDTQLFTLNEVIQALLVDEEIELFNPNYLAAR